MHVTIYPTSTPRVVMLISRTRKANNIALPSLPTHCSLSIVSQQHFIKNQRNQTTAIMSVCPVCKSPTIGDHSDTDR